MRSLVLVIALTLTAAACAIDRDEVYTSGDFGRFAAQSDSAL